MSDEALVVRNDEYTTLSMIAKVAVASQYHKMTEAQAVYVVLKGYELGMAPLQSIDSIDVIQGKPTLKPQAMLALINQSGLLQNIQVDATDAGATCIMARKGRTPHTETFTMQDATALGLAGKDNWKKQPKTMLKWRVIAAAARVVFPDVIQGCYTPDELGADVTENAAGEQIVIESEPVPPAPAPEPHEAPADAPVDGSDPRYNTWRNDVRVQVSKRSHPHWKGSAPAINGATDLLVREGILKAGMPPVDAAAVLGKYADIRSEGIDREHVIEMLKKEAGS